MPDYCFFTRDKQTLVLKRSDVTHAAALIAQGYRKEPEEVYGADANQAAERLADIRKENEIDRHNFLAGAATMPLIGLLTALAALIFWKIKPAK